MEMRPNKDLYYLELAESVSRRSTCLRRHYGAVIVKDDAVVSTGYNGAPRGCVNCIDTGKCLRKKLMIPSGERYELCKAVHAEQNAIVMADYQKMQGATLYLAGYEVHGSNDLAYRKRILDKVDCCLMCKRAIINAGIRYVCHFGKSDIYKGLDGVTISNNPIWVPIIIDVRDWIKELDDEQARI